MLVARQQLNTLRKEHNKIKAEQARFIYVNKCVTLIQSCWRGYSTRKQTSELLNAHRKEKQTMNISSNQARDPNLTISTSTNTLGERINTSLEIIKYPCTSIQQIIYALIDLEAVTRLSPECCLLFVNEEAVHILYKFIINCNRSIPHQDLIKICLQIFINLAKFSKTCPKLIDLISNSYSTSNQQYNKLNVLLTLLQSYQTSNTHIFVYVCVLFVLFAQHGEIRKFLVGQEKFMKLLQAIQTLLERRVQIKQKQLISKQDASSTNYSTKKTFQFWFNLMPEWSLNLKTLEFTDTLNAIDYVNKIYNKPEVKPLIKPIKNGWVFNKDIAASSAPTTSIGSTIRQPFGSYISNLLKPTASTSSKIALVTKVTKTTTFGVRGETVKIVCCNSKKSTIVIKDNKENKSNSTKTTISKNEKQLFDDIGPLCDLNEHTGDARIKSLAHLHSAKPKMNSTIVLNPKN
jgi:hypothetical protein